MEEDIKKFDEAFLRMIDLMKILINKTDKSGPNKKNPFLVYLNTYVKCYERTEKSEHMTYFSEIYDEHKLHILKSYAKDSWLKDGKIIIEYGKDVGFKSNAKIYLSNIYTMALKLQSEAEQDPEKKSDDLKYPEEFMLYLYQIFDTIAPNTDLDKIKLQINLLIDEVGFTETSTQPNITNSLMNMASNIIGKNGNFDISNLSSSVGQLFNNPKTSEFIGKFVNDIKTTNNVGDFINNIVGQIGNPELTNTVNNLVSGMSQLPLLNPQQNTNQPNTNQPDINPDEQE